MHWKAREYFVAKMRKHAEIIEREFPDKVITWSCHEESLVEAIQSS